MTNLIKKASIFNLGCKVNQAECDYICAFLNTRGIICINRLDNDSDIYIVNTCAVTNEAERKSRQIISRIRAVNIDAPIVIIGCASATNIEFYIKKKVCAVAGARKKSLVLKFLEDLIEQKLYINACANGASKKYLEDYKPYIIEDSFFKSQKTYDEFNLPPVTNRSRAYVKIQDGCNNYCSYCIIPYLRGESRSRTVDNIMKEVLNISRNAREIVITGINLSSYGQDNNMRLSTLFQELSKVNSRIRIGSFYAEAIDEELLEVLKQMPNFCEHFHLSLQSGSNRILKMMNRHYTSQDYVDKVELIRLYFPLASITTDIIVGFPNETDEDFNKTTDLVTEIGFSDLHIFPFSPRPLTQAGMLTSLPPIIIENRRQKLFQIREQLKKAYLTKMIKYPHNVIFEQELGDGISFGHSEYYIKVYAKTNVTQGIVNATKLYKDGLIGAVTNNCV